MLRLPEDGAQALKHGGVLIKHFNIYVCACVDVNNKQYKMHGMYIKKTVMIISFICILTDLLLDSNLSQNML
jgi:hypothetical protein